MSWRRTLGLEEQTATEKRAALSAISLFFGALTGANLGTIEKLVLRDYSLTIAVICLIVLYIHLYPVGRKRWSNLALIGGLYVLLIHEAGAAAFDGPRPTAHIFITICFWIASVAMVELRPVSSHRAD